MRDIWWKPFALGLMAIPATVGAAPCELRSGPHRNPVIELYTSEGCSSCPPADRWLSKLRQPLAEEPVQPVIMAFHVSYWDYIGWIDRFAQPAFNERQRELARREGRAGVYTPQLVRDGKDWPQWFRSDARAILEPAPGRLERASASILLRRNAQGLVQASVTPVSPAQRWEAYWTVTENDHQTKVRSGENRGEALKHDFVVRGYERVAATTGPARLAWKPPAAEGDRAQQINLVVTDAQTGLPLQALSLACAAPLS
ncbi:MAG: DUF1223 domain-containing protein [Burkholderiales bacterium]|nr:DUF1223 domain-containing protein [Burkholderiales bacterium]